jgi:hypothetical protein
LSGFQFLVDTEHVAGQPLGEKGGNDLPELVVPCLCMPHQLIDLFAEAVVGFDMLSHSGKTQLLHIPLFQGEVVLGVVLEPV